MSCLLTSILWEDILFKYVLNHLRLKELFIVRGLSKDCKDLIDTYFSKLETVNIAPYCDVFNPSAFEVLSTHCRNLKTCILSCCNFLSPALVVPLFCNNPLISYLVLSNCTNLDSSCLQSIIINCRNLKTLKLKNCTWITVGCLDAITLHQESLEYIDLSYCIGINKTQSLNCFISKFPKLKTISLASMAHVVMNSTMGVISKSCRQVEIVNIAGCSQVSDEGIEFLEKCPTLRIVLANGCSLLTDRNQANCRDFLVAVDYHTMHNRYIL